MQSQYPVTILSSSGLPIAQMHHIYRMSDVEARLDKLPPGNDHVTLRGTYERMLEKWPERFQVKPSWVPAMGHLYDELPNFHRVLDDVRRMVALVQDSRDPLEITPMLLLGPPWVGKTHFARKVSELLGTGTGFVSMSSLTAGWILSWASSQWKGSRPGKVFETLVDGHYANPVMIVDEIDKVGGSEAYDPLGALYGLLEHDTARGFIDEFAEVPVDTSQVIWVATANDARGIPDPILNRMNVYELRELTPEEARVIAQVMYRQIRGSHHWWEKFDEDPTDLVLEYLSHLVPREMSRGLRRAFGNAALVKRSTLLPEDFPKEGDSSPKIGFLS